MDLVVTVIKIKGHCQTYKVGDSFTLRAYCELVEGAGYQDEVLPPISQTPRRECCL
jgi:uncharacterized repeat protein (TIGR04076 family)